MSKTKFYVLLRFFFVTRDFVLVKKYYNMQIKTVLDTCGFFRYKFQ